MRKKGKKITNGNNCVKGEGRGVSGHECVSAGEVRFLLSGETEESVHGGGGKCEEGEWAREIG